MTAHPLDEVDFLIDELAALEDVLLWEIEKIHQGDFEGLQQLQQEKQALVPVLQRANSVVQAVMNMDEGITIEDDPDLYDLAVALIQVSQTAAENERVVGAAIKATQFTLRTMVSALRSDAASSAPRYSRSGNPVAGAGRRSVGLARGEL